MHLLFAYLTYQYIFQMCCISHEQNLQSCSFGPNVSLTVVNGPLWKITTWDLNMDVFEDDRVQFTAIYKQPFWPVITPEELVSGGKIVTLVIGIIVLTFLVGQRTRLF